MARASTTRTSGSTTPPPGASAISTSSPAYSSVVGRRPARVSWSVSGRGCSSLSSAVTVPLRPRTSTGTISSGNRRPAVRRRRGGGTRRRGGRRAGSPSPRTPQRMLRAYNSAWLMLSAPPAITTSAAPVCTRRAASITTWRARAASAVALEAGDGDSGARCRGRRRVRWPGFPVRVALAEDDVVYGTGFEPSALDERTDHGRGEGRRRKFAEHAAEPSDRGPQRLADDGLAHGVSPTVVRRDADHVPELGDALVFEDG